MDTISTILGPSITLSQPLVGGVSGRAPQTYSERKRREAEAHVDEEEEKEEISNTTTDGVNITADEVASDKGDALADNRTTPFAMYTPVSQDSGRIKTITTDVCDREDMVDTLDNTPNELAEVAIHSTVEAQSNRRRSTTDARANRGIASSFTAHPFGTIDASRYDFSQDGKINTILNRGKLM